MTKQSFLSFEDFNYDKAKVLLPEGYEPLPYIEIKSLQPEKLIKVTGYLSHSDAVNRIQELNKIYPSNKYQIFPNGVTINDYAVVMPECCKKYLKENEVLINDKPLINISTYEPFIYRFFNKEEYVDRFFNNGELLISTFKRCQSIEIKNRQDKYENQNKIIIKDGEYTIEIVVGFNFETLLFCTSLAQENVYNNKCSIEFGFKINRPAEFLDVLTRALVTKGIKIYEILKGPCVYNNKQIELNATGSGFADKIISDNKKGIVDFGPTMEYISGHAQNHILMNKPTNYSFENEYRYIWKLISPITKDSVTDDIKINPDGSIIIQVPELIQFCERL